MLLEIIYINKYKKYLNQRGNCMRIDLSVKHWLNIVCILHYFLSHLALSDYTKLDPPAALALIDENGHAEIPDTYTSISADAFESNLKSVTIPTITSIGDYAFFGTKLTSVFIPASVISIGDMVFLQNCFSSKT